MFRHLARAYLVNRLLRGGRHRRPTRSYPGWPYGGGSHYGYGRRYGRRRGHGGFFGPFPHYSRRTRGGSRVTVTGCCLPIPFGVVATLAVAAWRLTHH